MRTLLLVPLAIACAEPARSVDPVRAQERTAVARDAKPPADAASASVTSCPRAFNDIANGTPCSQSLQCPFPDGSCTCAPGIYCGGAALHPDSEADLQKLRWTCTPTPPKVRADGCPGAEPTGDTIRCGTDGQTCSYGDCCSFSYRCTKGRWIKGAVSCPP